MCLELESGQANLAGMQALLGCLLLADARPTAESHIPVTTAKVLDTPLPVLSLRCAKSLQLCLTFWDSMDCSPRGSSVHGILQARILEWVAMPSSRGSS